MARKVQLKNKNGEKAYPVTSSELVKMSSGGGNLDGKLTELDSQNNKIVFTNNSVVNSFIKEIFIENKQEGDYIVNWVERKYTGNNMYGLLITNGEIPYYIEFLEPKSFICDFSIGLIKISMVINYESIKEGERINVNATLNNNAYDLNYSPYLASQKIKREMNYFPFCISESKLTGNFMQIEDKVQGLLKNDGSIQSTSLNYFVYSISNNNKVNKYIFIEVPFENLELADIYTNICFFDNKGEIVNTFRVNDCRLLQIPYGFTVKFMLNSDKTVNYSYTIEPKNYESSFNRIEEDIKREKNKTFQILKDVYTEKEPFEVSPIEGYYINKDNGEIISNLNLKYVEINSLDYGLGVHINTSIYGGIAVAVVSLYNKEGRFLYTDEAGTELSEKSINKSYFHEGIIRISTNIDRSIEVFSLKKGTSKIPDIDTWGNSITHAGKYQIGINRILGVKVNNYGLSSDFSMHVRRRFLSYYTESVPYKGTATYEVPSFDERKKQLKENFKLIWIGTNNLLNSTRDLGEFTTGNDDFNALQPNPDFRYDRLYAKSYKDMMLNDIRQMLEIIPNNMFAIIGGHGGFSAENEMQKKMVEMDGMLARMYPRNHIDIRELACMYYNYQDTYLLEDFIKPALNSQVNIKVNDTSWIGNSANTSRDICIGTKDIYDRYHVDAVGETGVLTCTLKESNTEFSEGDTIRKEYLLVSDLGRDSVNMETQVYSYEDCQFFNITSFPRSSSDPIHFTDEQYEIIGELIGKEIQKIFNKL